MKKFFLTVLLFILAVKFSYQYVTSPDFQKYGDKTKAPWTCRVNNMMGHMARIMSEYQTALDLYDKTLARCPETDLAEEAMFQRAQSLADMGRNAVAASAFETYAELYKENTKRAAVAMRAAQILRGNF